jgi:hypothetical protein
MPSIAVRLALPIVAGLVTPIGAFAQPYCANYNDGGSNCCFPTLESCLQTVSGVGGICVADQSAQIPDNLVQRMRRRSQENLFPPPQPGQDQPGGLDWMPPPPRQ